MRPAPPRRPPPSARADPAQPTSGSAVWRLRELVPEPPPLERPIGTAIVGREAELAQLRQAFDRAAGGRSVNLFTVLGPAGIGKSRLVQEFCSDVADQATVLAGRCIAYGNGITFWPLGEIARQLAVAGPIAELLAGDERAELIAERVADATGLGETASSREEIFWAFRRLFEILAGERPLVVVFEDIHWAEPTLLDFIEYTAEGGREAPIMVVCLARLELLEARQSWGGGKRNASSLLLERLPEADSEALIERLAAGIPDATRARVRETAEAAVHDLLSGRIELLAGDPVAAERELRASYEAFRELGDKWFLATVAVHLPGALYEQGRDDDAFALTEAIDDVPAPADAEWEIKRREARARLLARRGWIDEAERVAQEAVAIAAQTEFLEFHADALMALAELLELAGRRPAAVAVAEEALELYGRKGIVASVADAQAFLGGLPAEA